MSVRRAQWSNPKAQTVATHPKHHVSREKLRIAHCDAANVDAWLWDEKRRTLSGIRFE
jgi:hypothetical protein